MSKQELVVQRGIDSEWPEPVRRAFIKLCLLADEHNFSIMCAVGFDLSLAKAGEYHLGAFFSPRASGNPHQVEMANDIAELFRRIAERNQQ